MANFKPIPITLITGYLGSGKTTLINHILRNAQGYKLAVIVNDLGEINIDANFIQDEGIVSSKDDSLVSLQNGCICCTLKEDLINQLADLVNSRKFDHILIEASGICEPIPIAQSIFYMQMEFKKRKLPDFYYLDAVVSVCDAFRLKDEFGLGASLTADVDEEEESIESLIVQQLEFCDMILLNKYSELTETEQKEVTSCISLLNRKASIIPTDYAAIDVSKILDTHLFDPKTTPVSASWLVEFESFDVAKAQAEQHEHDDDDDDDDDDDHDHHEHDHEEHEKGHHHHHHHHEHGYDKNDDEGTADEYDVQTYCYFRRKPLHMQEFLDWAKANARKIIRSKGVAYFAEEEDMCYIYESAGRQITLKERGPFYSDEHTAEEVATLRRREKEYNDIYDEVYKEKYVQIVFIGQHLDVKAIKEALDQM